MALVSMSLGTHMFASYYTNNLVTSRMSDCADSEEVYGVALLSRIDKIIGLFLQKSPIKEPIFCKTDL